MNAIGSLFIALRKFERHRKKIGLRLTLKFVYSWLRTGCIQVLPISSGRDVIAFYSFIRQQSISGDTASGAVAGEKTVTWVVPDFGIGSGGHLNIFRFLTGLEANGYECRIVIDGSCQFESGEKAREVIIKHFFPVKAKVYIGLDSAPPTQYMVATSWTTAYGVRNFCSAKQKLYFVQDFEPFFYAQGAEYAFAEATYRFGFTGITAGSWISEKLTRDYGMRAYPVGFSYDRDAYYPRADASDGVKRVFFYARPPTARRGFELGLMALEYVASKLPDVEFVLAGWDVSEFEIPFKYLNAGVVALDELPDLYSKMDVALVLSFTNLSLLPLELMACGCPVVSNKGGSVEWLLSNENAVLVDPVVEVIGQSLVDLLRDDDARNTLIHEGLKYTRETSWSGEIDKFIEVLKMLENESENSDCLVSVYD